ncbi:MAG: FAD-dependent oxidoreductase [Pseudohongiella sp.]|nr:FAD-dependent oxidoreductase [Pseudohongiella sp.]
MNRSRPHLLIVGNGMATNRLLTQLQLLAPDSFRITVIGQEKVPAYNRILLTPWLNGEISTEELRLQDTEWYTRQEINMHLGDGAAGIDVKEKKLRCESGKEFDWDLLVLATGSQALIPPVPGHDLEGVMCLRTQNDAAVLRRRCSGGRVKSEIAVVGGGVLGLEAACAINAMGLPVTVIHRDGWLMNRQLDKEAGEQLADAIRARGIKVYTGVNCTKFIASKKMPSVLRGVELLPLDYSAPDTLPQQLPCHTAVLAIGIKPEISLAKAAGLTCERAIVVDEWMRTSAENIFALGECCQINREMFGLVAPVYQQADVLASLLADGKWQRAKPAQCCYKTKTLATRLKVAGLDVYSVGLIPDNISRSLIWRDRSQGHYRRMWLHNNQVVAAVAMGDTDGVSEYASLIDQHTQCSDPISLLLGGQLPADQQPGRKTSGRDVAA